jgi:hypothetical protein
MKPEQYTMLKLQALQFANGDLQKAKLILKWLLKTQDEDNKPEAPTE